MKWLPASLADTRAELRLFCLPYAGGGASVYRTWSAALPSSIQVCPVQLPGRENRLSERPLTSTAELVPLLTDALRPFLDRPFAFFGHSMGALLAFETTRELRRRGLPLPRHLFLSSHRAPHLRDRATHVHLLHGAAFMQALRDLQGTPEEVLANEELMQIAEPILRADFQLCETYAYTPSEPLTMPMSIFGGDADRDIPAEDLEPWSEHTRAAVRVRLFPGHHLYIRDSREAVLSVLAEDLARGNEMARNPTLTVP